MNKNRNKWIMIGIIAVTCGQLFGLTRKEFAQLNRFKKQIEARFAAGPEVGRLDAWSKENEAIIGQMRRLDRRTAAKYQRTQAIFTAQIAAAGREAEALDLAATRARLAQKEAAALHAQLEEAARARELEIKAKIEALALAETKTTEARDLLGQLGQAAQKLLRAEGLKVEVEMLEKEITNLTEALATVDAEKKETIARLEREVQNARNAKIQAMDNILTKAIAQNDPISRAIGLINPRSTPDEIDLIIIRKIDPLFFYIRELLSVSWGDASQARRDQVLESATNLTKQIEGIVGNFGKHIVDRNANSQALKDNFQLSRKDFDDTAQAILAMKIVIAGLYEKLPQIFDNVFSAETKNELNRKIALPNKILSKLKTDLYNIYEARQAKRALGLYPQLGKITIQRPEKDEDDEIQSRSSDLDDPLRDIPPPIDEIGKAPSAPSEAELKGEVGMKEEAEAEEAEEGGPMPEKSAESGSAESGAAEKKEAEAEEAEIALTLEEFAEVVEEEEVKSDPEGMERPD